MATRVAVIQGDITQLQVDAIVNAANETLLGGGGVDGAIHDAAGPELFIECATLHGCEPGNAKVTRGHRLAAPWVIHTVGPVWRGGAHGEPELLAKCYRRSLEEAVRIGAKSIAFPAISTGAFGYPIQLAAKTAARTVLTFMSEHTQPEQVLLVCFDRDAQRSYAAAWAAVLPGAPPN